MNLRTAMVSALLVASTSAFAQTPSGYLLVNRSAEALISDATVDSLFSEIVSAKLIKLYPVKQWGFAAQVEGGITQANMCVVTARVMLLPRNQPVASKLLLFKPGKMATAYDAIANASAPQCKELAAKKLREANQAIVSALVPG